MRKPSVTFGHRCLKNKDWHEKINKWITLIKKQILFIFPSKEFIVCGYYSKCTFLHELNFVVFWNGTVCYLCVQSMALWVILKSCSVITRCRITALERTSSLCSASSFLLQQVSSSDVHTFKMWKLSYKPNYCVFLLL